MVFGILVVYNPSRIEIDHAIKNLIKQCDKVVICNNSDNGVFIDEYENCKVFNFNENLGIAKAQSIGMHWAFNNGALFVIQMDQDSTLNEGTISKLIENYNLLTKMGYKVGVIGPRHYDKISNEVDEGRLIKGDSIPHTSCEIINATISSASLIPIDAYNVAGDMDNGLFIDSVDWEYCWRLKSLGFDTVRVNDVLLGHRVGNGKKKIIGSIDARVPSPIRHYYHTRNLFLLSKRNYVPTYWKISNFIKLILKLSLYGFVFDDGRKRLNYIIKGIKHGLQGKYGRIDIASKGLKSE